jgi:hypothetical protein
MPVALATVGWLWLLDSKFSPIDRIRRAVFLASVTVSIA